MIKKIVLVACIPIALSSCVAVKGYEKVNINDPDMVAIGKVMRQKHYHISFLSGSCSWCKWR